jgi:hypothetical protein
MIIAFKIVYGVVAPNILVTNQRELYANIPKITDGIPLNVEITILALF